MKFRRSLPLFIVPLLFIFPAVSHAAGTMNFSVFGGTFNGNELVWEEQAISDALSLGASNGGVSGWVSDPNSQYQFQATNGAYFELDGANIGSQMTLVHRQNWVGVANNLCESDLTTCHWVSAWSRTSHTIGVVTTHAATVQSSSLGIGGWAFNGGEQVTEANDISYYMSLAGGNGGVSGWSYYQYSQYVFTATNGVYFTLNGQNIGSKISIVHTTDNIAVEDAAYSGTPTCLGGWSNALVCPPWPASCHISGHNDPRVWGSVCNMPATSYPVISSWGRYDKTLGINIAPLPSSTGACVANNTCGDPNLPPVDPITCNLPWGGTIPDNSSVTAYQQSSVNPPTTCASVSQTRTCSLGVLSGSYTNQSCVLNTCPAQTTNNCVLPVTNSGSSAGSCTSGYAGSCSYTCGQNHVWTQTTNTCATASLSANPTSILQGQSSTLSWNSSGANSCTSTSIPGFPANGKTTSGQVSVSPSATTPYSVTCGAATANTVVTVIPPNLTILAVPTRVRQGSGANVSWSAQNISSASCSITRNEKPWKTVPVTNHTVATTTTQDTIATKTTYTLTCGSGNAQKTVSAEVNVVPNYSSY